MRPKKDPEIKKEAFIVAATDLFKQQGYAGVSVRSILDAAGDKSTSTGIFYYYFSSKDELYRECVKAVADAYIAGFGDGLSAENDSVTGQILRFFQNIESSLVEFPNLIHDDNVENQLFILDMKEKVTQRLISEGKAFLVKIGLIDADSADHYAQFICGGIGEMMFLYRKDGIYGLRQIRELVDHMIDFSLKMFLLDEQQKQLIRKGIADWRKKVWWNDGCVDKC